MNNCKRWLIEAEHNKAKSWVNEKSVDLTSEIE